MEVSIDSICGSLSEIAPLRLAEEWDNVGLLLGDRSSSTGRVMTCLTVTPGVVSEAERSSVGMLVAHHPLPFKPLSKVTSDTMTGTLLLRLASAGVALYSAHTAFDSAIDGINDRWAAGLGLAGVSPLVIHSGALSGEGSAVATDAAARHHTANSVNAGVAGAGRYGRLPADASAGEVLARAVDLSGSTRPRIAGDPDRRVRKVAIACGSGGSFISSARRRGCDMLLTGEATFHQCLEAESAGMCLGLVGHYASERFMMDELAERISGRHPGLEVWASREERDPVQGL